MRKEGLMKRGLAAALVCAMAFSVAALSYGNTYAADAIDVDATCSLSVDLSAVSDEYVSDLEAMTIPVNLYKVAAVDVSGNYTELEAFAGLGLGNVNDQTTADKWLSMAKDAMGMVQGDSVAATDSFNIVEGTGQSKELSTGMYLVAPQNTFNADYTYEYQFTPYLTALPGNNYYSNKDDTWIYHPTISLKVGRERQYGSLVINKTLENYSDVSQEGYFVFQIEGKLGTEVYSDVETLSFTGGGSQSVTIEGLPAGMKVTVTEVYDGGSYQNDGDSSQEATIVAEKAVELAGWKEAGVSFTNTYNNKLIPGTGVLNEFKSTGTEEGWTWENPTTPEKSE